MCVVSKLCYLEIKLLNIAMFHDFFMHLSHCHWYSLLLKHVVIVLKGGHALAVSEEGLHSQGLFIVVKLFIHLLSHFVHTELKEFL